MNSLLRATNIQRFSLHDGPGIRTTVFLKGCLLRCPWCSNPENLNYQREKYIKDGKEGVYGRDYTCDEIFEEVMKDKAFYDEDGGVTFSGGEALLQATDLIPLLSRFKQEGITTAVETSLFVPTENLLSVIHLIDFFYVDMKIMDIDSCKEVEKGDLSLYLANLDELIKSKKITVRIPVIGGYTDGEKNRKSVIEEIKKREFGILKIELIKEHNLAESKYKSLGMEMSYHGVSDELMNQYKKEFEEVLSIPVEVCKI